MTYTLHRSVLLGDGLRGLLDASLGQLEQILCWPGGTVKGVDRFDEWVVRDGVKVKVPARIERFTEVAGPLQGLAAVAQKYAETATGRALLPFKDKINFKYPGGGGFLAHQDTPAFEPYGSWHVTVLIPLVDFTRANGTLEFADHSPPVGTPLEALAKLDYTPVELKLGDLVTFDGATPHRSQPNQTDTPRPGIYLTFTDATEGDLRTPYFEAKKSHDVRAAGLSLNQRDFTGELAPAQ